MQTIEELKAAQAKALAKLETEHAIASACPVPSKRTMEVSTGERAWVTYDVESLWGALDIMAKFQPIAFAQFKGTYTRYEPAAINDARKRDKGEEKRGPFVAKLEVSQGRGFGPSVEFAFFADVPGIGICKVRCDFGYNRGGGYGATFRSNDRGSKRIEGDRGRMIRGDYTENGRISAMAETYSSFATGSDGGANYVYAFQADYEEDGIAGYDVDAIYRLENLATQMHGERSACIHANEYTKDGRRLTLADGSVWLHPFNGGAPICEVAATKS